jgi:hypothetical protein
MKVKNCRASPVTIDQIAIGQGSCKETVGDNSGNTTTGTENPEHQVTGQAGSENPVARPERKKMPQERSRLAGPISIGQEEVEKSSAMVRTKLIPVRKRKSTGSVLPILIGN